MRFAEASASGSSVLAGRKNKGALAYRDLAKALLKHWKTGKALPTFTADCELRGPESGHDGVAALLDHLRTGDRGNHS